MWACSSVNKVTVLIFNALHCIFFIKPVDIESIMSIVCKVSRGVNQHFNSFFHVSVYHAYSFCRSECFMTRKCSMVVFLGVKFWSRVFFCFVWSPRDFFGFDYYPHLIIPVTWNPEYPPGLLVPSISFCWLLEALTFFNSLNFARSLKLLLLMYIHVGMGSRRRWTVALHS